MKLQRDPDVGGKPNLPQEGIFWYFCGLQARPQGYNPCPFQALQPLAGLWGCSPLSPHGCVIHLVPSATSGQN